MYEKGDDLGLRKHVIDGNELYNQREAQKRESIIIVIIIITSTLVRCATSLQLSYLPLQRLIFLVISLFSKLFLFTYLLLDP